jgi:hypothetical protein
MQECAVDLRYMGGLDIEGCVCLHCQFTAPVNEMAEANGDATAVQHFNNAQNV